MTAVPLSPLRPLFARLTDLKRIRTPDHGRESLATVGFRRAWAALVAGDDPRQVALRETALALAATELGGIDANVLESAGLTAAEALAVARRALARATDPVGPWLVAELDAALADPLPVTVGPQPAFVDRLAHQPRAGAAYPAKPRLILEPPESHADHCYCVAVIAVVLGPWAGESAYHPAFLAGLSHHLPNAALPDAGIAGEELLGDYLAPVMARFTDVALNQLPPELATQVRAARDLIPYPDSPAAKCFHAADILDRVLQLAHHDRVAQFRVQQAPSDLELVPAGPSRAFQNEVLIAAGVPS